MAYTGSYQRGDIQAVAPPQASGWVLAWKIYFFVLLAINLIVPSIVPEFYIDLSPLLIVDITMMLLGFVGLFGFAWKERIISHVFWKGYCIALLLYIAALFFVPPTSGVKEAIEKNLRHVIIVLIPLVVVHLPLLAALFWYGFRSKEIWGMPETPEEKPKKR